MSTSLIKLRYLVNLKTTNINEIIIPDRCKTLDLLGKVGGVSGGQKYNTQLYGTLGKILINGIGYCNSSASGGERE